MQEILNLITNFGIGIVCMAYIIYSHSTTMKEIINAVNSMNDSVNNFNARLELLENKIDLIKKGVEI